MAIERHETNLPGVDFLKCPVFPDERGHFTEAFSQRSWTELGYQSGFVQDNVSLSAEGVLRGMHYQLDPHGMGKLIRPLCGVIFDAAIDLRQGSPTFGESAGFTLEAKKGHALWVPSGFAHGFLTLEKDTLVLYKCTSFWVSDAERTIAYDDPEVAIEWPEKPKIISPRDATAPRLKDAEYNFRYGD